MKEPTRHSRPSHAFVVRIWWEAGLTQPDGRPLWRGQVWDAAGGQPHPFQSLAELAGFIEAQAGILPGPALSPPADRQKRG